MDMPSKFKRELYHLTKLLDIEEAITYDKLVELHTIVLDLNSEIVNMIHLTDAFYGKAFNPYNFENYYTLKDFLLDLKDEFDIHYILENIKNRSNLNKTKLNINLNLNYSIDYIKKITHDIINDFNNFWNNIEKYFKYYIVQDEDHLVFYTSSDFDDLLSLKVYYKIDDVYKVETFRLTKRLKINKITSIFEKSEEELCRKLNSHDDYYLLSKHLFPELYL